MNAEPHRHHPLFYTLIACGVVVMVAVLAFVAKGGRLPGLIPTRRLGDFTGFPNRRWRDSRWQTEGVCHGPSSAG